MKKYTEGEVSKSLRDRLSPPHGTTQKEVAQELGFSPQFLNDVLSGRRDLTERLANSLGFRYVSYYVRKRPEDQDEAA